MEHNFSIPAFKKSTHYDVLKMFKRRFYFYRHSIKLSKKHYDIFKTSYI